MNIYNYNYAKHHCCTKQPYLLTNSYHSTEQQKTPCYHHRTVSSHLGFTESFMRGRSYQ